jgi:hypothetical protein
MDRNLEHAVKLIPLVSISGADPKIEPQAVSIGERRRLWPRVRDDRDARTVRYEDGAIIRLIRRSPASAVTSPRQNAASHCVPRSEFIDRDRARRKMQPKHQFRRLSRAN